MRPSCKQKDSRPIKAVPSTDAPPPTLLKVRLTPRGGKDMVSRFEDGVLHVRVSAPPVDGAANSALIALIAETLSVPKSSVLFRSGETSREKVLHITTLTASELLTCLVQFSVQ